MRNRNSLLLGFLYILLVVFAMAQNAYISQKSAVRAVRAKGYTDVQITGRSWFLVNLRACDEKAPALFEITATGPTGKKAQLTVCTGLLSAGAKIQPN